LNTALTGTGCDKARYAVIKGIPSAQTCVYHRHTVFIEIGTSCHFLNGLKYFFIGRLSEAICFRENWGRKNKEQQNGEGRAFHVNLPGREKLKTARLVA
jgi:hypothetical protein